jgi:hypothetical protein
LNEKFQVFTATSVKTTVIWDVEPGFALIKEAVITSVTRQFLPGCTAHHPRRQSSSKLNVSLAVFNDGDEHSGRVTAGNYEHPV